MTTYNWSLLTNNQIVPFVPGADLLNIDDASISAADLSYSASPNPTDVVNGTFTIAFGGKTVTFGIPISTSAPFASLFFINDQAPQNRNIIFADGSRLVVGDNTISTASDDLANTMTGSNGDDAFMGLGGNDTMNGGLGNDSFYVFYSNTGVGNDSINGGDGFDTLIYNSTSTNAVIANLATHTSANAQGTATLISIETILGTAGIDNFTGGDAAHGIDSLGNRIGERFRGNNGNDLITGGSGVNFFTTADYANNTAAQAVSANLFSGTASDGRGFTDTLVNVDALRGGAGDDVLTGGSLSRGTTGFFFELFRGNAGNDTLNGNNANSEGVFSSTDRADYSNNSSAEAVNVNLATGTANDGLGGTDTLIDIDEVYGGAGNDTLTGGTGRDALDGGVGNDILDGGANFDSAHFVQSTAGVIVNLSATSLTVGLVTVAAGTANDGMGGTDTLSNIEAVRGSDFADYIRGSDSLTTREVFRGDAGNDTIDGGAGTEDFASYSDVPAILGGLNAILANGSAVINDRKGGTDTLTNIEGLGGTHGNDTLTGGAGDQWFSGNGGSDLINGGPGSDWVTYFGAPSGATVNLGAGTATDGYNGLTGKLALGGTDTLVSIENAEGSEFNDNIIGSSGDNILRGRAGNDVLNGGLGSDTADYTTATAAVSVELFNNQVSNDGQGGADTLSSIENAIGSAFNDLLFGDNNNNVFRGAAGNDQFYGGAGSDTADYSTATVGVSVDLVGQYALDGQGGFDYLNDIENLSGSAFNDYLSGNAVDNSFKGGAGNDTFVGGAGRDTVDLSSAAAGTAVDLVGQYAVDGQGGTDFLVDIENITGSAFGDYLSGNASDNVFNGGASSDIFVGLAGNDTADYSSGGFGIAVDLAGQYGVDGLGGTDFLVSIENVIGSAFDDYLSGTTGDNVFKGGAGSDILVGLTGNDTTDYSSGATGAIVDLAAQYGVDGLGGTDFLVAIENVIGSAFNDYINGSSADNTFRGGAGNDTFVGGAGIDTADYSSATAAATVNLAGAFANDGQGGIDFLVGIDNIIGSALADTLVGDGNANRIDGAAGNDFIAGNAGADSFAFNAGSGFDIVTDFSKLQGDKINLQSNLNGSGITTSAQALAHTFDFGGNAIIDLGGSNSITLVGVTTASLAASDFVIF
jgi:Ca2+-binding RTX toxin-like protein